MSVIDLHPEALIDRAQRGVLTPEERARLDEHLARCVACRFEVAVRRDFAAEEEIDDLAARVSAALRVAGDSEAPPAPQLARARTPRWAWAAAALVLLVSSGIATAQTGLLEVVARYVLPSVERDARPAAPPRVRRSSAPRATTPPPAEPVEAPASDAPSEPTPAPPTASERVPTRATAAREVRARAPAAASPRAVAPSSTTRHRSAPLAVPGGIAPPYVPPAQPLADAADVAGAPIAEPPPEPPPETTAPAPVEPPAPEPAAVAPASRGVAALLFAEANELRRQGRVRDAVARYRALQAQHPSSAEARVSLVVLGRLELDRGELDEALASFSAYVATGERTLREQALAGRALALGRLERAAEECAAFAELLRSYPASAYASLARARCERP